MSSFCTAFNESLTNDIVSFEQLGPDSHVTYELEQPFFPHKNAILRNMLWTSLGIFFFFFFFCLCTLKTQTNTYANREDPHKIAHKSGETLFAILFLIYVWPPSIFEFGHVHYCKQASTLQRQGCKGTILLKLSEGWPCHHFLLAGTFLPYLK